MKSHELAKILLDLPDMPIATHANNHTYKSDIDHVSHGSLLIAKLKTYGGDHLVIGNCSSPDMNKPNWYITEYYHNPSDGKILCSGSEMERIDKPTKDFIKSL